MLFLSRNKEETLKRLQALIAATIVTGIIAVGMFIVGANAILNPNSIPVSNSPAAAGTANNAPSSDVQAQAEINQLQSLIHVHE